MLIIFSGRPGSGKTTLARALARKLGAVLVRIDSIEEALLSAGQIEAVENGAGYRVGYDVAADNLRLGRIVIADSVNPIRLTREAWHAVARHAGVPYLDVAVACSDAAEHRRRIETRDAGVRPLRWQSVLARVVEPVDADTVLVETAGRSVEDSVAALVAALPPTLRADR
jgi:predicted kinase